MSRSLYPRCKHNISAVRKLLRKAFSDEELSIFCYDYFREVYHNFAIGMTLSWKGQLLIEYCERKSLFNFLLARIRDVNETQFMRYIEEIPNQDRPEGFGINEDFANTAYELAQGTYHATAIQCLEAGSTYRLKCALAAEETEGQSRIAQIREALDAAKSGDRYIRF